ncbi:MAG: TIGR03557 family F420-dependent LLM class oxidoreductase [Catenulispora sp.]|nr:TIGR03557 family F420-dependent LLM class oxidoreductase [Catenulispora sp.]
MTTYGYFLASEEWQPDQLIEQAGLAQEAGFTALAISDHFHPWVDAQGSSPFVWSTIGALSQVTDLPITTLVTCPTVRTHPAIVAQAAATSAVLTGGRFRFGVGTGEALNEHITGERWPRSDIRADMLEEAVEIIRMLFTGDVVDYDGLYYTVDNARLYTVPDTPIPIHVSAFGPKAAQLAGEIGDGLVTVQPDHALIQTFRESGGADKPVLGGMKVCWDSDPGRAAETAHRLWASELLPGELAQVLPTPTHFEQATELVTVDQAAEQFPCGDDPDRHVAAIQEYVDAGFDEIYISQIGPRYKEFFDGYREQVLPRLRSHDKEARS